MFMIVLFENFDLRGALCNSLSQLETVLFHMAAAYICESCHGIGLSYLFGTFTMDISRTCCKKGICKLPC